MSHDLLYIGSAHAVQPVSVLSLTGQVSELIKVSSKKGSKYIKKEHEPDTLHFRLHTYI